MKVCGSCGLVCEDDGHLADDAATVWANDQIRDFNSDYFIHTLITSRSSTSSSRPSASHTRQSPIKPGATIAPPSAKIARLGIDLSALDRNVCLSPPRITSAFPEKHEPTPEKHSAAPEKPASRLPAAQQPDKSRSLRECLTEMAALCRHFELPRDVQSQALNRLADVHPYFKQRPLNTQLLHTAACLQLVCKTLSPPRKLSLVALVRALSSAPLAPDPSLLHSVLVETHKFLLLVDTRIASLQPPPPAAEPMVPLDVAEEHVGFLHEFELSDQNFVELVEHLECFYNRAIDENSLPVPPTRVTLQNAKRLLRVLHALSRSASSELSKHTLPTRSFALFAFYNAYLHMALRTPTATSASTSTSTASAQCSFERAVASGGSAGGTRGPLLKSRAGRTPRRDRKHRLPAPPLSLKEFTTRLRVRPASDAAAGGHVLRKHASMLLRALQAELARRSTQLLEALGLARLPAGQFEARLPLCLGDLLDTLNVDACTPFIVRAGPPAAPTQATEATAAIRDDADVNDEECDGDEELDEDEIDTYLRTDDEIQQYLACESESDKR